MYNCSLQRQRKCAFMRDSELARSLLDVTHSLYSEINMNSKALLGKKIAVIATDGFEQSELTEPKRLLESAGADVDVIAPEGDIIKGWDKKQWGENVKVDLHFDGVDASSYDALVIPGGVINPDKLRMNKSAVDFIRQFAAAGKTIAAICHGPQMLIEADLVRDRQLTSWPSLQTDLRNAGASWSDREVVSDGNLITSRKPEDIPAFVAALSATLTNGSQTRGGARAKV
jgi:protease I